MTQPDAQPPPDRAVRGVVAVAARHADLVELLYPAKGREVPPGSRERVRRGRLLRHWYFRGSGSGDVRLRRRDIQRLTTPQTSPMKVFSTKRGAWWFCEGVYYWEELPGV